MGVYTLVDATPGEMKTEVFSHLKLQVTVPGDFTKKVEKTIDIIADKHYCDLETKKTLRTLIWQQINQNKRNGNGALEAHSRPRAATLPPNARGHWNACPED